MTEEQKAARNAALAKARDASKAKRAAAAAAEKAAEAAPAEEPPMVMPPLSQNWRDAEPLDPEAEPEAPPEAVDPFERFLASQDEETRSILSDADLRVIFEVETKKAQDLRRENTKKLAAARASRFAKVEAGLLSNADAARAEWVRDMNRKVRYRPSVPRDANGNLIDLGYRINGQIVYDGQEIVCTKAEALSLREMEWRATNHEMDFEGKGRVSQQRQLSAGALNAKL